MKKIVAALFLMSCSIGAAEDTVRDTVKDTAPLLSVGAGIYNPRAHHLGWVFQAEYKWKALAEIVRPQMGIMMTDRAAFYAYAGVGVDLYIMKKLVLTPSFSPGVYFRGHGKDLGYPLEFRSCVELAYVFDQAGRLGAQVYHISNAHIGHKNPGMNAFALFYAFRL